MTTVNPVVIAATARHTATLIFFHGLGDTGHGWASSMGAVRSPHIKVICPTAPTMPVTLNAGFRMPSWFDLRSLEPSGPEDEEGIRRAAEMVHSLIAEEVAAGIPTKRIVLGGFSQGGALAIYSALTFPEPLAGVIALSAWLPLHQKFPADAIGNKNTPLLQCHGDCDPIVPYRWGQLTASVLKQFMTQTEFKTYRGMMHASCDEMYKDLIKILHESIQNSTIYIVILTGNGSFFSSGNDFKSSLTSQDEDDFDIKSIINILKEFVEMLIRYPKLLIAIVNGPAIGIAATMLPLFDIVYAADNAYFETPFTRLGLSAEGCSTYTFPNIFGKSKASEMLYLGYKMSALEAKHYGFINEVYKYQNLDEVWTYLKMLTKLSLESILAIKCLVNRWNQDILLKVNEEEITELTKRLESPECIERLISHILHKNKL